MAVQKRSYEVSRFISIQIKVNKGFKNHVYMAIHGLLNCFSQITKKCLLWVKPNYSQQIIFWIPPSCIFVGNMHTGLFLVMETIQAGLLLSYVLASVI